MKTKVQIIKVLYIILFSLNGSVALGREPKSSNDVVDNCNTESNYKRYTILDIQANNETYEVIASDNEGHKCKIITAKENEKLEMPIIEIGQTYLLSLTSIEELLGIEQSIPSVEITYDLGGTLHETNHSEGIYTIYYTENLYGLYYLYAE